MLNYDFENSFGYTLALTAQACERAFTEALQPHGITFRQGQVLAWLALEGELSQAVLAERMHVEPPTLVGILDRMEREGWIVRERRSDDRRHKSVSPGPQAPAIWDHIAACMQEVRARAVDGFSNAEVQQLRELLTRVQTNLGSPSTENQNGLLESPPTHAG